MAVTTTQTNKPLNPRGNDQSPKGYNRSELYTGKALDFDGVNDTLSTDYAPSSNIQTTAYWVKLDSLNANGTLGGFVGSTDQFGLYYFGAAAAKNFGFNTWNNDSYGVTLPDFVDDWFHIVAEYNFTDFTQSKIFVNAQELSISQTKGTTLQRTTASRTFKIDSPVTPTQEMNGKIAGVKVFEGSLTAAQVADLYNNPEKVVPTGVDNTALKLWLPMQEGAGTYCINGAPDALGNEILTQPIDIDADFSANAGGVIVDANTFTTAGGSTDGIISSNLIQANKQYRLEIQGTTTSDGFTFGNGGTGSGNEYGSGFGVHYFTAAHQTLWFRQGTAGTTDITTFSIKELKNVGTISGATWTHGIGAPVAQTAVIDWNKHPFNVSTDILIPQGLTAGRDIGGSLFENARKQGALNLDGNSWAEVHDNASLDFGTGSFSLEAWAKASYKGQGSVLNTIMVLGGNSATGTTALNITNGLVPAFYYNTSSRPAISGSQNEGDWFHIVGVYDETNQTIYVNGQQDGQSARTAIDLTNTLVKYIGRDSTTVRYYQDTIAQPRIYNRALTAEEVLQNYNSGKSIYQ